MHKQTLNSTSNNNDRNDNNSAVFNNFASSFLGHSGNSKIDSGGGGSGVLVQRL